MQPSNQQRLDWLAHIYRVYAAALQRHIASKVSDPALAEDLTSIVFLKALRWLREDQSEESARGWLYATARTTLVDHWQAQGQYEMLSLSGQEEQLFAGTSAEFADQQAALRVQRLLSLLPERERDVLTLRFLQGYSAAEIARALGTNAGHIRVLQLRALRHAAQLEEKKRSITFMQEQEPSLETIAHFFTPQSRRVLDLAREEMLNLKLNFIGTEHILWGLVSEGSLASFFAPVHITPERIHGGIVFIFERQAQMVQSVLREVPTETDPFKLLTPRARQTIALAAGEAKDQGEKSIRPAHLLLGLLNEGAGIGAGLLRSLGVSFAQARVALSPATAGQVCSFCWRTGSQVKHLFPTELGAVSGDSPTASVFICDQCVERFHAMLEQGGQTPPAQPGV